MTLKGGEWRLVSLKLFAKELRNKAAPDVDMPDEPSRNSRLSVATIDVVAECVASRKLQYTFTSVARKRRWKREQTAALVIQRHVRARWLLLRPDASANAKSMITIAKITRLRREAARTSALPEPSRAFPSSVC